MADELQPNEATGTGPESGSGWIGIAESGRLAGGHRWLATQLFELLGRWSVTAPEVEVRLLFSEQSRLQARHAELWSDCLPSLPGIVAEDLTAAPSRGIESLVVALEAIEGPAATVERLVGVHRVLLPAVLADLDEHRRRASPIADGPTLRTIDLVAGDLVAHVDAGGRALDGLLADGSATATASAARSRFDELLSGADS